MSRAPGEGTGTYTHPKTLEEAHCLRLARRCIRDQQSFAMVHEKAGRFAVWCPQENAERFIALIEDTREL